MPSIFLIGLLSKLLEFLRSVFGSTRMFFVILSYFGMAVITEWNSIVYIFSTFGVDVSYLDIATTSLSAKTTVTVTPKQNLDLVILLESRWHLSHEKSKANDTY